MNREEKTMKNEKTARQTLTTLLIKWWQFFTFAHA
jgi:hypothetical protein